MTSARWAIDINRDDIGQAVMVDEAALSPDLGTLEPGAIEVRLDSFAMTANNVTYAAIGTPVGLFDNGRGYWDFFSPGGAGPGRLPVWGFATVTQSTTEGIAEGEQFYGFYPMASHVQLTPGQVDPGGFSDMAPHRAGMPSVYDHYARVSGLADFIEGDRDWWPVFRPLYLTGWLIADQFEDEGDHSARQVIVSSASSKTAIGFAHAMLLREERPRLVGLTSSRGRAFLAEAGLYDELILYDDIAGDSDVTAALHNHLADRLLLTLIVGKAHWDSAPGKRFPAIGFFAPARVEKRLREWGPGGFRDRVAAAWAHFLDDARTLFRIEVSAGADAALAAYQNAVAGRAVPRAGVLIRS